MIDCSLCVKAWFEFIGTAVLILLGDGVVASNILKGSKGYNGGWVVITMAWGFAVMCGVFIAGPYSGAHLNPAVSIGLAAAGVFPWAFVPAYIAAQLLGSFAGAVLVYLFYKDHYDITDDSATKLATFCTTGYAINPARDLPPRFAHFLLPIRGKGPSGWGYSWVPVVGPVLGSLMAAAAFVLVF